MGDWEIEHINHAIHPEAHPPEYVWHKYWARKPHNVVRAFIERYCPPGGIVLDPFSGSGVTAIEAVRTGRRAIAVDINPIAIEILRATLLPVDMDELQRALDEIEAKCKDEIQSLYLTRCRNCRREITALGFVWERDSGGEHRLKEVRYKCEHCGDEQPEGCEVDAYDRKLLAKIEKTPIPYWYPDYPLRYANGNPFMKAERSEKLSDLFTQRNLTCASSLYDAFSSYAPETPVGRTLRTAFTSIIHLCTRFCPPRTTGPGHHHTAYSSAWLVHSYWIPPKFLEMNVWTKWTSAVAGHQGIIKAKDNTRVIFNGIKEAKSAKSLKIGNTLATTRPYAAYELPWILAYRKIDKELGNIPNGAGFADYVFTDPPYDAEIQYGELSALWNAWLKGPNWDWNEYVEMLRQWEAINNQQQGKGFDEFSVGLYHNFQNIRTALKPGAYMHLTFHSPTQKIRNATIRAAVYANFIYEHIHYQPPSVVSTKALLQPYGSATGDYIFRFRKPESMSHAMHVEDSQRERMLMDKESFNKIVVQATKQILAERSEPVPYTFIINHIDPELTKHGFYLKYHADWNVDDVLANSGEFTIKTITIAGKEGPAWWFKDESEALRTLRVPLTERVEYAVLSVLKKQGAVDFTQALDRVYIDFPNSLTPDSANVMSVLKEYAEPAQRLWRLAKREIEVEHQHSQMIWHLGEIGRKLGYEVCIGRREPGDQFMGSALGTLTTAEPNWGSIDELAREGLKQVDCLWHKAGKIHFAIEVENTTQFTEAMIRSQVLEDVKRVFVVPGHRQAYIRRRLANELFNELIKRQGWRFMTYEALSTLANRSSITASDVWDDAATQLELGFEFSTQLPKVKRPKTGKPKGPPEPGLFDPSL